MHAFHTPATTSHIHAVVSYDRLITGCDLDLYVTRFVKKTATGSRATRLAEIDAEIDAKIAERKLFLDEEIRKATGDALAESQLRKQLSTEIARLEEKRETEKEKIRAGSAE